MKATFIGNPIDENDSTHGVTMFGRKFPLNIAVDVSDLEPAQQKKLAANNHFSVDGPVSAKSLAVDATVIATGVGTDADALRAESDALLAEAMNPNVKVRKSTKKSEG